MPMNSNEGKIDLAKVRALLEGSKGKDYWRSLDQVAETPEFQQWVDDEFPNRASLAQVDRRSLLKYMAASMAFAGLAGCRRLPQEKIVPLVQGEPGRVAGKPLFYRSAFELGGYAYGITVESYEGRPVKIEGNPQHPASLGATDAWGQAALLGLYDPDRSRNVTYLGDIETWDGFFVELRRMLDGAARGARVRVLHGASSSPTAHRLMGEVRARYPQVVFGEHEPGRVAGQAEAVYDFSNADVVFSLDSDFLLFSPGRIPYARQFMDRRRVEETDGQMNRLYMVQSSPTITGCVADHTVPVLPSRVLAVARMLEAGLAGGGAASRPPDVPAAWLNAAIRDLQRAAGRSIVIPGEHQPPAVHAAARRINEALGNVGSTVRYAASRPAGRSLRQLVDEMNAGAVDILLILGANPVYTAPGDLRFAEALKKVRTRIHMGHYHDETAQLCDWHLPESHFLEAWGDATAFDGTVSIVQPLIEPLHETRSQIEVLAAMAGAPAEGLSLVQATHGLDEASWRQALHDGIVRGGTPDAQPAAPATVTFAEEAADGSAARAGVELVFRLDPTIYDGRFANNGWLQELPKTVTQLTWDNAFIVSPAMAERLKVENGDYLNVTANGVTVKGPALIVPGQPDQAITAHLGYGRWAAGRAGTECGFNAYALQTSANPHFATGVQVTKAAGKMALALTQLHNSTEGRDIIRWGTLEEFRKRPNLAPEGHHVLHDDTLYNLTDKWEAETDLPQWGMTIDLNTCIGCNACVVACQAENNIPVVGKEQVARGREMHWIRIDRYWQGGLDNPETHFQPMLCMHCETAPCEPVCPVAATVHSHEGLNQMIYNRCIGTRYCSNNCPYKVRRFNYLNYQFNQRNFDKEQDIPLLKLINNPEVTVRSRGVMEKCTYCVQRINAARIEAKKEQRPIRDGEVVPACAQACPTRTIVFGNVADPNTAVSRLRMNARTYALLEELNTRPRTTYLAKVKNPNPEITA